MKEPLARSGAAVATASVLILLAAATPGGTAIDAATKCESSKVKIAGKYANCRLKAISKAVKKSTSPDFGKCLEKFDSSWLKTETKANGACPTNDDQIAIGDTITAETDAIASTLSGVPASLVGARAVSDSARCEAAKLKTAGKYAGCRLSTVSKAIKKAEPPAFDKCDSTFTAKWAQTETKLDPACPTSGDSTAIKDNIAAVTDAIATSLTGVTTTPARCGDATIDPGEDCETDGDCGAGEACSVCCTCVDTTCPDVMEWTMHAGTGLSTTSTDFDWGWTGYFYDRDFADDSQLRLKLCSHAGSGPVACGEATVGGVDPTPGNCRCINDNRTICDEPFEPDADDCGGSQCVCYLAPPEPYVVPHYPGCFVRRLVGDIGGTWNVDTGAGALTVPLSHRVFLGAFIDEPCPTCDGDTTRNDGLRDGVCNGGENDGSSCDANSIDASFPAPGGGAYSYDCFPTAGLATNTVVGDHILTTGSTSLDSNVVCGSPGPPVNDVLACPCGVCGDTPFNGSPCNINADCATCTTNADCTLGGSGDGICDGSGRCECVRAGNYKPAPNQCSDGICVAIGGAEGECNAGPDEGYCDGILHADGGPMFWCTVNADCTPLALGIDAGNCTLSVRRRCFLDPILATGAASATDPVTVAAYCTTATGNGTADSVIGLPGPARVAIESTSTFRCAGDPGSTYPGCP